MTKKRQSIRGWLARDKDGELWYFDKKPTRHECGYWMEPTPSTKCKRITTTLFLSCELKWEDEPIEVEISVKRV